MSREIAKKDTGPKKNNLFLYEISNIFHWATLTLTSYGLRTGAFGKNCFTIHSQQNKYKRVPLKTVSD